MLDFNTCFIERHKLATKCCMRWCYLHVAVPGVPRILARESTVMNNTITFVWESHGGGGDVGGYVLELDDGSAGQFRVCSLPACCCILFGTEVHCTNVELI